MCIPHIVIFPLLCLSRGAQPSASGRGLSSDTIGAVSARVELRTAGSSCILIGEVSQASPMYHQGGSGYAARTRDPRIHIVQGCALCNRITKMTSGHDERIGEDSGPRQDSS
ncbi:hypothetical protein EJ04DRAFT_507391 [Polyplosphaeria fusca]|uniref:Secreted protein n=1 Tax=Polyplosphaeria fusca TaxID=682080 RepID=A0A9P4RCS7_9PLEO|nr:hypothetical protein EJ04DRAFT_507391 [Polyplosphaeria fusca]